MSYSRPYELSKKIHLYDGYQSPPNWKEEENNHTYHNISLERRFTVPIRSVEILKKELGIT